MAADQRKRVAFLVGEVPLDQPGKPVQLRAQRISGCGAVLRVFSEGSPDRLHGHVDLAVLRLQRVEWSARGRIVVEVRPPSGQIPTSSPV